MLKRIPAHVWFTLMVAAVVVSLVAVVLEYLGIVNDLGVVMSLAGLALSIVFGFGGATRVAAEEIERTVADITVRVDAVRLAVDAQTDVLGDIRRILADRLPGGR